MLSSFSQQAEQFNLSPVMNRAETLDALVDLLPLSADQDWLEVACGPGIISRALAPRVRSVLGVDLTPAMIATAEREAARLGLANLRFTVGDATTLHLPDASVDGAVTRFSLHHLPLPWRCLREMARVVRPGGWVAIGDHVTSEDRAEAAWHQEIERLRDPSHWACLTPGDLRALGAEAGLELREERLVPFAIDFEEWWRRGGQSDQALALVRAAFARRPEGVFGFQPRAAPDGRLLILLHHHITLWQRPG